MSQIKNTRQSNFELLRIISMLLVLLVHYTAGRQLYPIYDIGEGNLLLHNLLHTGINLELKSISIVCVNCFIFISGYWGIKFKLRSFSNLMFQMIFWSIACVVMSIATGYNASNISFNSYINSIIWGWFPTGYLILFVFSPILNSFIKQCSEKELLKYIILFYLLSTIGGYLLGFHDFREGMSAISLMGLYLIGAYLRITTLKIFTLKAKYDLLLYFGLGLGMVLFNLLLLFIGVKSSPYGYLNPIIILMSIYLFLFFKKIDIGYIRIINFLAASAFSIYLFHCNLFMGDFVTNMWKEINSTFGFYGSIFVTLLSFIAIYLFCVLIDQIRIFIYKYIEKGFIKN